MLKQKTACLILIGDEILSGRTHDLNLPYVAAGLNNHGIRLMEARVVPDLQDKIADTINAVRPLYDFVFTTGGIGPTHDDITAESVAYAFGVPYEEHTDARRALEEHYEKDKLNESRLKMAKMPRGARLIGNHSSGAPGFAIENVYVMAGVPRIMQAMFDSLSNELGDGPIMHSEIVQCFVTEGNLAKQLTEIQARNRQVEIGSYPFYQGGKFGTSLVVRSLDLNEAKRVAGEIDAMVRPLENLPPF